MFVCEVIFGVPEAVRVRELIEEATGKDCPCIQGRPCPLVPAAVETVQEKESVSA